MITIFNRRELICTNDMKKQAKVREQLSQFKIPYLVNVVDGRSPSLFITGHIGRIGTFGNHVKLEYQYRIFVKKKDYEKADAVITGKIK